MNDAQLTSLSVLSYSRWRPRWRRHINTCVFSQVYVRFYNVIHVCRCLRSQQFHLERFQSNQSPFSATTCKTRPAGRVRPATLFCPAREMFLNYNGNRPAACHRPPLHYTIEGLNCLPLHRLKTNVITTFVFFVNDLLIARWIVWILISTDISVDRSFHL